jgi:hypothetical protein
MVKKALISSKEKMQGRKGRMIGLVEVEMVKRKNGSQEERKHWFEGRNWEGGGIGKEELRGGIGKLQTRKERKTAGNVDELKNARY